MNKTETVIFILVYLGFLAVTLYLNDNMKFAFVLVGGLAYRLFRLRNITEFGLKTPYAEATLKAAFIEEKAHEAEQNAHQVKWLREKTEKDAAEIEKLRNDFEILDMRLNEVKQKAEEVDALGLLSRVSATHYAARNFS